MIESMFWRYQVRVALVVGAFVAALYVIWLLSAPTRVVTHVVPARAAHDLVFVIDTNTATAAHAAAVESHVRSIVEILGHHAELKVAFTTAEPIPAPLIFRRESLGLRVHMPAWSATTDAGHGLDTVAEVLRQARDDSGPFRASAGISVVVISAAEDASAVNVEELGDAIALTRTKRLRDVILTTISLETPRYQSAGIHDGAALRLGGAWAAEFNRASQHLARSPWQLALLTEFDNPGLSITVNDQDVFGFDAVRSFPSSTPLSPGDVVKVTSTPSRLPDWLIKRPSVAAFMLPPSTPVTPWAFAWVARAANHHRI